MLEIHKTSRRYLFRIIYYKMAKLKKNKAHLKAIRSLPRKSNNSKRIGEKLEKPVYKIENVSPRISGIRELADKQNVLCSKQEENSNMYVILDIHVLNELFECVKCGDCGEKSLSVKLSSNMGFVRKLDIICDFCEISGEQHVKKSSFSSKRVGDDSKSNFDINIRACLSFLYIGCGYSGMQQFGMITNMPILSKKSFDLHVHHIHKSCNTMTEKMYDKARTITKRHYIDLAVFIQKHLFQNIFIS